MCSTMQNNSSLKARYTSFNVLYRCFFDKTLGYFIVMTAVGSFWSRFCPSYRHFQVNQCATANLCWPFPPYMQTHLTSSPRNHPDLHQWEWGNIQVMGRKANKRHLYTYLFVFCFVESLTQHSAKHSCQLTKPCRVSLSENMLRLRFGRQVSLLSLQLFHAKDMRSDVLDRVMFDWFESSTFN